jgi:hypothetical protein
MAKATRPTRAERREQRAAVPEAGIYGVDAEDAGASSWRGRYLTWAADADDARQRIKVAGFHKKQIRDTWTPRRPPPDGPPAPRGPDSKGWCRSRLNEEGWTAWQPLPPDYRHPSSALAATDPTVR